MNHRQNQVALRLSGDIDYDAADDVAARLDAHLDGGGDIVIDVGDVSFVDVSGCRVFVRAASQLPPMRRLVLLDAKPSFVRTLSICGWLNLSQLLVVPAGTDLVEV
jgi:anti-anti-sigma factor